MIYPRLLLAKEFLADDGIIFVSIDDNELPLLRLLMDEIFNRKNMLSCFIWQTEGNFDNQAKVKICHEYILAYRAGKCTLKTRRLSFPALTPQR
jgi:adenine specific DNA methylase Mod